MRWAIVSGTVAVAFVAAATGGLRVSFPSVILATLPLAGALCYYRHQANFALCLTSLLQIVLFSTAFVLLTYLAARLAMPLVDKDLAACDAALGFDASRLVAWQAGHTTVGYMLQLAYDSMLIQTGFVVALLGLRGDRALETFVLRMMLGGLLALAIFLVMPAEGPFSIYGYAPSASQAHYLDHLRTLRSGERTCFSFADAEGLITFPSFHTTWALLLTVACLRQPIIRVLMLTLNAAVIFATLTTGWHYLTDVLGGVAVFLIVVSIPLPSGASAQSPDSGEKTEVVAGAKAATLTNRRSSA